MPHEEDLTIDLYVERSDKFIFVLYLTRSQFDLLKEQLKAANIRFDYVDL